MNFVLEYLRLEDKRPENIRLPYECEWCGDNYGGRKRKYCSPKCREEEHIHLLREDQMDNLKCDECGKPAIVKEDGLFLCGLCSAIIARNTDKLLNNECTSEI